MESQKFDVNVWENIKGLFFFFWYFHSFIFVHTCLHSGGVFLSCNGGVLGLQYLLARTHTTNTSVPTSPLV